MKRERREAGSRDGGTESDVCLVLLNLCVSNNGAGPAYLTASLLLFPSCVEDNH